MEPSAIGREPGLGLGVPTANLRTRAADDHRRRGNVSRHDGPRTHDRPLFDRGPREDDGAGGKPGPRAHRDRAKTTFERRRVRIVICGQEHGLRRDVHPVTDGERSPPVQDDPTVYVAEVADANTALGGDPHASFNRRSSADGATAEMTEHEDPQGVAWEPEKEVGRLDNQSEPGCTARVGEALAGDPQ